MRKALSKKVRFEVFKRDSFTCQYCGESAPSVVLHIDHINPIKHGGNNDILNLITSCKDCNNGKGARKLTDKQEIKKQQEQLKQLSEKKEQLELMLKWREELLSLSDSEVDAAEKLIHKHSEACELTEYGRQKIKRLIKEFTLPLVLEAIDIAFTNYDDDKNANSWNAAFDKLGGICNNKQRESKDPAFSFKQRAYFTFRKKFHIRNEWQLRNEIERIVKCEKTLNEFYKLISKSRDWYQFFENSQYYGDDHA